MSGNVPFYSKFERTDDNKSTINGTLLCKYIYTFFKLYGLTQYWERNIYNIPHNKLVYHVIIKNNKWAYSVILKT